MSNKEAFDPSGVLKQLPTRPGIYRMLGKQGEVIYVGKARNLKRRVASYFSRADASPKTRRLVEQIHGVEVTVTRTEDEALLLENNLIKELKPRYNVLLRDDKSYPYIRLSEPHDFPRLSFYRGERKNQGRYFGPYPNAGAVRDTLNQLQRLFKIRQCEDTFYRNRTRPCLQYQIKRCTAPCVGLIGKDDYQNDLRHAIMFLEGKNREVVDELIQKMDQAAGRLDYEQAAYYRDQIATLRRILDKNYAGPGKGNMDIIASAVRDGVGCVVVFYIRGGRNLGNKTFFPQHPREAEGADILTAFLSQYYIGREVPDEILVNEAPDEHDMIRQVLERLSQHKVTINARARGERSRWLQLARDNAEYELKRHLSTRSNLNRKFAELGESLGLDEPPQRLECFDISHLAGEATVASCVVFDRSGPRKADYRRFNIKGITPGDDYAAMRQALMRRYLRLKKGEAKLPDILLIDGGKGQIAQVGEVFEELQISGIVVIGIAKGRERKPGLETLHVLGRTDEIVLPPHSSALQLIQYIRDEAHRFALAGHRGQRMKARSRSQLEAVPGIGPGRRRVLLKQFGGLQGVERAGVDELAKVPGINKELAQRIYDTLHGE
jgi:excinuclease ABC subunit C